MENDIFICDCEDIEHQLVVSRDVDEKELTLSIHLSQYQKTTKVKIATFLSELEPINKEIINSELLEYKYTDIPGESLRSEIEIIYINTDNNTAFIKYTSIKTSDTWINLEYLDL